MDIFINALPPLGERSASQSYPNVGKNHSPATLNVGNFEILKDIKPLKNFNLLWATLRGEKCLPYSTEYDIVNYVSIAISDIIQSCGIQVSCSSDFGVSGLKADIMVLANSNNGLPIGIAQVKKPSSTIMVNEKLHGQTYNYMLSIAEIDNSANATELDIAVGPPTILQKPYSLTSTSNLEFSTTTTTTNDILPPTPDKRLVYGSKVYKHSDIQLPKVLYCIDEDVLF
ncbi:hypothetical protein ACTFIT_000778 [Dictyostelium discoideum]